MIWGTGFLEATRAAATFAVPPVCEDFRHTLGSTSLATGTGSQHEASGSEIRFRGRPVPVDREGDSMSPRVGRHRGIEPFRGFQRLNELS